MQSFRINNASSVDLVEEPVPVAGAGEVLVRIRAASLNARDRILLDQVIDGGAAVGKVALSDGAGVVESVGERATRFQVGDRVVNCFHPMWFGGVRRGHAPTYALELDGWLTEFLVVSEQALLRIPDHLSFEEAATLPCAGVTAWSALAGVGAGDTVLVQGSGGVSIFAAQFAVAAGARVIATTSSAEKATRFGELGVQDVVNYVDRPDWGAEVRRLTGGRGVDLVVEIGGAGSLAQSSRALAYGGRISLIGNLAPSGEEIDLMQFFWNGATLRSIAVGSRSDFEDMNRVLAQHQMHPVIDRVFPFSEAHAALSHFRAGARFGKVVISHEPAASVHASVGR
jgi:NADPH:quinone reductase-like Zn-dependent oxidoreductase